MDREPSLFLLWFFVFCVFSVNYSFYFLVYYSSRPCWAGGRLGKVNAQVGME